MNKIKNVLLLVSIFFGCTLSASMRPASPIKKSAKCSGCGKKISNSKKDTVDYMLIRVGDGRESRIVKLTFVSPERVILDNDEENPSDGVLARVFQIETNLSNYLRQDVAISMLDFGNSNNQRLIKTYYFSQTPDVGQ